MNETDTTEVFLHSLYFEKNSRDVVSDGIPTIILSITLIGTLPDWQIGKLSHCQITYSYLIVFSGVMREIRSDGISSIKNTVTNVPMLM